ALLRCKKPFTMATFNANTIREEGRARELAHCFKQCNIDILGIQEHRKVHVEETQFSRLEGQYLVTSSAWRNLSQAAVGGVGLMLSPKARKALRTVTPISERILVAEFDSNPVTTVIVIYSPTNVAP
uniref:Endonuclease/exonuclease/phosphatase domain-containing protein n=1 Tax=Capitella teleta TaxID=283909 RepID=X2B9M6_CAPTE